MKLSLLLVISLAASNIVFSQRQQPQNKNIIMLDAAGPVVAGVGVGYERYLSLRSGFKPTARAGFGLVNSFQNLSGYVGSGLLWGGTSNVELGINYLFQYDQWAISTLDESESQFENGYQLMIGYRYQARKGFLGRIYWVVPVGCCGNWIPVYSGLALGWAF